MKLLIVDDERIIRETIASLIDWEALGMTLIGTAENGIEAYNMILDDYPEIILTDIKIPGLSGLDLIQRVKEISPETQFVILSGYGEFEFAQRAMQYGVKHYLLKPCNEEQIIASLNSAKADYLKAVTSKAPAPGNSAAMNQLTLKAILTDSIQKPLRSEMYRLMEQSFSPDFKSAGAAFDDLIRLIRDISDLDLLKQQASSLIIQAVSKQAAPDMGNAMQYLVNIHQLQSCRSVQLSLCAKLTEYFNNYRASCSPTSLSQKIISYTEQNLEKPGLSLKWLAENYLFMNVDYASKRFAKETGVKFSKYLNDLRIQKAKYYMESGAYTIHEIAELVGCGQNPQYFSQIFKKNTGLSPSQYLLSLHSAEHEIPKDLI